MEVIILAGGFGTRLRSVVNEVPKCMAPIANKPFLWYLLKYLTKFDVSKVILSLGYLRGVIIDWIDECKDEFPFAFGICRGGRTIRDRWRNKTSLKEN